MDIESQRWEPVAAACAPSPGGFGWSQPLGSTKNPNWEDVMELENGWFLFDAEYGAAGVAGAYIKKACTNYSSYPDAWKLFSSTASSVKDVINVAFDGKPGRILDLDVSYDGDQRRLSVIFVPNYGAAQKAWWWGVGATADNIAAVTQGKAWPAGNFTADNIKKKVVAIDLEKGGRFSFVANQLSPGEAWWWGYGASVANLTGVINGKAWGNFKADNIKKRLVSLKARADGFFTFILIPWASGVAWWWKPNHTWKEIADLANANNARIIDIEQFESSGDKFSAILVKNT